MLTLIEQFSRDQRPERVNPDCTNSFTSANAEFAGLLGKTRLLGSYFGTDRQRLRQFARQRSVHTIDNVAALMA